MYVPDRACSCVVGAAWLRPLHIAYVLISLDLCPTYVQTPQALAASTDQRGQGDDIRGVTSHVLDHVDCDPDLPTVLVGDLNIPSHLDWATSPRYG